MSRLIDADALIEHMRKAYNKRISDWDLISTVAVIGAEEDAKPIRHGHWEEHAVSIKDVPTESCSICGEWSYGDCERYCPKCGALMNEIEVEEER